MSPEFMVDDILRSELTRLVTITESGQRTQMEMLQVITRAQMKSAIAGNHVALRDILKAARELNERDVARAEQAEQEKVKDYEIFAAWKKKRATEWAEAER